MKKILLSCFLLAATVGITTVPNNSVYAASATVTRAAFLAKVSTLDGQIAAGNTAGAETTWTEINEMMISVLDIYRNDAATAAPADRVAKETAANNLSEKFQNTWNLKADMVANRAELNAKLNDFALAI